MILTILKNKIKQKIERFCQFPKLEETLTSKEELDTFNFIRNLFKLGKGNNKIKGQVLRDGRSLFEDEDYYKPI